MRCTELRGKEQVGWRLLGLRYTEMENGDRCNNGRAGEDTRSAKEVMQAESQDCCSVACPDCCGLSSCHRAGLRVDVDVDALTQQSGTRAREREKVRRTGAWAVGWRRGSNKMQNQPSNREQQKQALASSESSSPTYPTWWTASSGWKWEMES